MVKNLPAMQETQETWVQSLAQEDPLEEEMAPYSSILAWRIPWICFRKGDPFQGPKLSSCLTLRNELSKETHVLTKQEILLGKGTRVESSR